MDVASWMPSASTFWRLFSGRSLAGATLALLAAGTCPAAAQNAQGIANMFGGLIGAAIIEQNRAEWQRLSPDERTCVALGIEHEGQSIQRLINAGVAPNDPRLETIRSTCASLVRRQLRINVECTINTPQGTFTSRCDEDFARGAGQDHSRLSRVDAIRAAFSESEVTTALYERPDAIARREQMMADGATSGTVVTPNFDCAKAHRDTEVAICGSAALSKLDAEYGDLYRRIHPTGRQNPVARQAMVFFDKRNDCGSSEDCIRKNLENSVEYMARVLRKRGEPVVTSIEQAQKIAEAEKAKAVADERHAAEEQRAEEARLLAQKEQQEEAARQAAERQKRFSEVVDKAKAFIAKGSDFLKFDPANRNVVAIAEAIAAANAALQSNDLAQVEAAADGLQRAVEDDPGYAKYVSARAEERSRENARLMAGAIKTAEQQQRFLVAYIAQNPTSPAAAASIGLVKQLKPALATPDLNVLQGLDAQVEDLLRRYALQDNFLLSLNAVDDKTRNTTADSGSTANLGIVTTDKNRFLLEGAPNDLVLMYVSAPSAPHVVKNLRGDIVFDKDAGTVCIYQKTGLDALRDRVRLAMAKYKLNQLLIEATPCQPDALLTKDVIAVDRAGFLRQDSAYASALLKDIEVDRLRPLLSVSDQQIETAIQSIETKRKQIQADIDHGGLDGFALVLLPAVANGPICGALGSDLAAHQAILNRFTDPTVARLRQHLSLEVANFDVVFADVQHSRCGAVYGKASDLKLLLGAFRRDQISYEIFPKTVSTADVQSERQRLADAKATDEKSALERQRQVAEAQVLASVRDADEAKTLAAQQAASRAKYGKLAAATAALIADEVRNFVEAQGDPKLGEVGANVPGEFPHLAAWYRSSLLDHWELQSVNSDLADYGTADWKGRTLEGAVATIHVRLKNRILGEYRDGCFDVGRLIDHEFNVTRDPVDASCHEAEDLTTWKAGHGFKSFWNLSASQ